MTSFLGIKYPLRATGVIGKTIWSYIILSITWRLRVNFYWLYGSRSLIWNSCCRDCKISTCTSTPRHRHSLNELRRVSYILVRQSTTTIYHRKTEACKHWWMFPSSLRELKLCNRGNSLPVHGLRNLNSWFVSIQVVRYKVIPDSGYTSFYFDTCRSAVAVACTVTFYLNIHWRRNSVCVPQSDWCMERMPINDSFIYTNRGRRIQASLITCSVHKLHHDYISCHCEVLINNNRTHLCIIGLWGAPWISLLLYKFIALAQLGELK